MSGVRFSRVTIDREAWQAEFDAGVKEWAEWIHNEKSRRNIIARKNRTGDEYEKAYFFGVLTGAKRAHPDGFPETTPKRKPATYAKPTTATKKPRSGGRMRPSPKQSAQWKKREEEYRKAMEGVENEPRVCPFCGHVWRPRTRRPKQCPKCRKDLRVI